MTDFLLELLTEEIPARMQADAAKQLYNRVYNGMLEAGLLVGEVEVFVTPRRLAAFAQNVAATSVERRDERRGPRADAPAPDAAIAGFVKSTGLSREQLEARDTPKGRFLYATVVTAGRPAAAILAELIPAIVRDFDWPKSMRWGEASVSTASPRWVRPLSGIVALLGGDIVPCAAAGITSGRSTFGHRFMSHGPIEIASAVTYVDQLRAAHVMLDPDERVAHIKAYADAAAEAEGLKIIFDEGLRDENAGLTEWPVPLLGRFDPTFLDVPREVIQLTMRTNQKYFACTDADGALAPAFVCVANLAAADGGAGIVAGNRKVLAARLADAKFFWDADRAIKLEDRLPKLADIVFHEKLGTVADKVERVAKLARWLVESGAVHPLPFRGGTRDGAAGVVGPGREAAAPGEALRQPADVLLADASTHSRASVDGQPARTNVGAGVRQHDGVEGEADVAHLADLAETAARLCKADLVSATVGEFPEVQGIAGGHLALAEGLDPRIAAAIRDHYKPVGPSDEVPTAPVTVAVALADKLDTLVGFFGIGEGPTGSRDPFALRRAAIGVCSLVSRFGIRFSMFSALMESVESYIAMVAVKFEEGAKVLERDLDRIEENSRRLNAAKAMGLPTGEILKEGDTIDFSGGNLKWIDTFRIETIQDAHVIAGRTLFFIADRLKVQQREAGIRPDVIDAVFSLGGEDDLVRLVARAKALQAFIHSPDGGTLLAGYRRGTNIVRIEETKEPGVSDGEVDTTLLGEPAEVALATALDAAVPAAAAAVAAEDFTGAMTALARLRPAVDAFFEHVTVNAHEQELRRNRLALLARLRTAVHTVADFSKLEG